MRPCIAVLALLSVTGFGCARKEVSAEASAEASASSSPGATARVTAAARQSSRIGGGVTMLGDLTVELVVHRAGLVEAVVLAPDGELVRSGKLVARVSARGDASGAAEAEAIALAFAPARARFEGRAQAGVELRSGPVELTFELDGKTRTGSLALAIALEPPAIGGQVLVAGDFGVEAALDAAGELVARVHTATGARVESGIEIEASVPTASGALARVALAWDAPRAAFVAKANADASAKLVPGPLTLTVKAGGAVHTGGLAHLAVAAPRIDGSLAAAGNLATNAALDASADASAGAKLAADAKLAAGAKAAVPTTPKVKAGATTSAGAGAAAGAKLAVTAPKVNVSAPEVSVKKSASASATSKPGGAKASASFRFGTK